MSAYEPEDPAVVALIALCAKEGGHKAVADEIGANDQTIYQITSGVLLPSGNARGVGPQLRRKLTARFPDWLATGEGEMLAGAEGSLQVPTPSIETALQVFASALIEAQPLTLIQVKPLLEQ